MQVLGINDTLLCIAFPAMLCKLAQAWHSRLELRSIDSFKQLEKKIMCILMPIGRCHAMLIASFYPVTRSRVSPRLCNLFQVSHDGSIQLGRIHGHTGMNRGLRTSNFTYSLGLRFFLSLSLSSLQTDEGKTLSMKMKGPLSQSQWLDLAFIWCGPLRSEHVASPHF